MAAPDRFADVARAIELLNPPPPRPEVASPVVFAETTSRGQWRRAAHLEAIEREVLHTIDTAGRLIVSVSFRHGKSEFVGRKLPAWYLATHPDKRVMVATNTADLARAHGRASRDLLTEYGPDLFGISVSGASSAANEWGIEGHSGGMLTLGVGGSPIGRGADLMIIDDPYASFEDAMSPRTREKVRDWWTGTMASRVEPGGAVIVICARWHENDLTGFLLEEQPDEWREVRMPAICDDPATDPLGRAEGEALWPERYPLHELERVRETMSLSLGDVVWMAQGQQSPRQPKGGKFPEDRWVFTTEVHPEITEWVRAWDLAASEDEGDFTVGMLLGRQPDGRFLVRDVVRGQWGSDEVRARIKQCAYLDPKGTMIRLPQDPGQAGKDQAQQMVRMLAGYNVVTRLESGSKEIRATGWSAQQRARNVVLLEAPWNGMFVAEHVGFPRGSNDDQVDASSSAFNELVRTDGTGQDDYELQPLGR